EPRAREERGFTLPDSWLRGVLAGAEGVLGTWLLVVIPSIAVYIATAAAPELGSASWLEAGQIGTGVWLAAHGAHLEIGEATFTLLPLGVTLSPSPSRPRRSGARPWRRGRARCSPSSPISAAPCSSQSSRARPAPT